MDIAQCSPHNPERDCQRVLVNKYQLALPVQKTQLGENDKIPILKIRHWFEFFHRHSCLHILHGLQNRETAREQAILSVFGRTLRKYTLATNSSKRFLREGLPQRGPSLWFFMGMKAVAGVIVHTLS